MCTDEQKHGHYKKCNEKNRFEDIMKIPFLNYNFLSLSTVAVFLLCHCTRTSLSVLHLPNILRDNKTSVRPFHNVPDYWTYSIAATLKNYITSIKKTLILNNYSFQEAVI